MSAIKNVTPVILISISATNLHEETGVKCYKVELLHADFGIDKNDIRYNLEGAVTYAIWLLKVHKAAEIIISNDIEDPIKKTLPPTKMAQLAKTAQWSNRLAALVKEAWEDGVYLEIHRHKPTINKDSLPANWVDYHVSTPLGMPISLYANRPDRVDAVSIGKHLRRPGDERDSQYQYLGQYFPSREQNAAVISEVALIPGHPLEHGNMDYDPSKVQVLDLHNPNNKVIDVKPKVSDMEGFQKAFDATAADTGGYITKACSAAVDNSIAADVMYPESINKLPSGN